MLIGIDYARHYGHTFGIHYLSPFRNRDVLGAADFLYLVALYDNRVANFRGSTGGVDQVSADNRDWMSRHKRRFLWPQDPGGLPFIRHRLVCTDRTDDHTTCKGKYECAATSFFHPVKVTDHGTILYEF